MLKNLKLNLIDDIIYKMFEKVVWGNIIDNFSKTWSFLNEFKIASRVAEDFVGFVLDTCLQSRF